MLLHNSGDAVLFISLRTKGHQCKEWNIRARANTEVIWTPAEDSQLEAVSHLDAVTGQHLKTWIIFDCKGLWLKHAINMEISSIQNNNILNYIVLHLKKLRRQNKPHGLCKMVIGLLELVILNICPSCLRWTMKLAHK